jgi:hypothetical protein
MPSTPARQSTQQVAQAPGQQAPLRALHVEIGGTGLVGTGDGGVVVQPRQHQHRHVFVAVHGAQRAAGLETVQARHQRIQHHHVGRLGAQQRQGLFATGRLGDAEAAVAQRVGRHQQADAIVVHQQHAGLLVGFGVVKRELRCHELAAPGRRSASFRNVHSQTFRFAA